jgi:hypothetical protein
MEDERNSAQAARLSGTRELGTKRSLTCRLRSIPAEKTLPSELETAVRRLEAQQFPSGMTRKRKATSRHDARNEAKALDPADARLRINTWEDVADSEDEFHINRDRILLEEGPARKKRRHLQDEGRVEPPGVAIPESGQLILRR